MLTQRPCAHSEAPALLLHEPAELFFVHPEHLTAFRPNTLMRSEPYVFYHILLVLTTSTKELSSGSVPAMVHLLWQYRWLQRVPAASAWDSIVEAVGHAPSTRGIAWRPRLPDLMRFALYAFRLEVVSLIIEILGPDCEPLRIMAEQAKEIASGLRLDVEIRRITAIQDILDRGVTVVPAIVIDGNQIGVGRILSREALEGLLADSAE